MLHWRLCIMLDAGVVRAGRRRCKRRRAGADERGAERAAARLRPHGDDAGVTRAFAEGAVIDSRNRLGETPLVIALKRNQSAMAKRLIEAGANVHLAALNGVTPLMAAAYGGDTEIAAMLLERGAD